eukprot:12152804-Ditylum_brightwellii.AAC.1
MSERLIFLPTCPAVAKFVWKASQTISASAELLAVMVCLLETKCRGLFIQRRYPEMDLDLKRSCDCSRSDCLGDEAS